MAINLSRLTAGTNTISQLSGAILATPNKKGFSAQNIKANKLEDAMVFSIEADNSVSLTSDITDHVVEDNTVRNDQIALKPELYVVRGFVGELEVIQEDSLTPIRESRDRLLLLQEFVPELTINAIRAYNAAEQAVRLANNLEANFKNNFGRDISEDQIETLNNQQRFYLKFKNYWSEKTLFEIQTPWETLKDMAIQTLKVIQDETTKSITDFEITFKKIRFANTIFETDEQFEKRLKAQSAKKTNNGNIASNETNENFRDLFS